MFLGTYDIDEYVAIPAATHRFSSGAAYQPTALTYSIYEEGGTTGLDEDVDMTPASPFDAITGAYYSRRQLTAAAGFERDKTYLVAVKATVDSVAAVELHVFQIRQKQTGDSYARLGAPAGASVSADIAALIIAGNDINNTINRTLGDHGTVSQAAMKISAVDGTAFVDFGLPAVLTNGVAQKAKLTITDSAGKKLVGYIKAAGTGETYGSNIVSNGNMETGNPPSGWYLSNAGSLSSAADGFSGNCLQITETGGGYPYPYPYAYRNISVGKGKLFKWVSGYVKAGTGASYRMYLLNSVGWSSTQTASGSWVNKPNGFCFTYPHETEATLVLRNMAAPGSGQTIFFDEMSIQQILTPSATGVTITSTPDGSTYNWESQESGFNYNDASGYSYTLSLIYYKGEVDWTAAEKEQIRHALGVNGDKTTATGGQLQQIPTNPLLTGDDRLDNLDATISSRSTLTAAQVWAHSTRTLSSFGSLVADTATAVWGSAARTLTAISDSAGVTTLLSRIGAALTITGGKVDVNDKTGFSLTSGERTAIANEVEAQIIDDTDSEKVLQAIVDKIAAVNPSLGDLTLAAVASAIRTELATELGRIDAAVSTRLATSGYTAPANADIAAIKAKTDNLPASPAAVGSAMTLTSAYDAAKTAASQTSVNAIPTGTLLADDARLNNLDATVSSRLAGDDYTAPDNARIAAIRDTDVPALQSSISALDFPSVTTELENVVKGLGDVEAALLAASIPYGKVWEYTCTNSATGMPIQGVKIVASTDEAGLNAVAEGYTDAFGVARLYLVPGTYYIWRFKPGFNPVNPDVEVVE